MLLRVLILPYLRQIVFVAMLHFSFPLFWIQVHKMGKGWSVLLHVVPSSFRQLCGGGFCRKYAPQISTSN